MKPYILVDVDNTLVDTGTEWVRWMNNVTGLNLSLNDVGKSYDTEEAFVEKFKEIDMCPYDFWRSTTLYDCLRPYPDAERALREIKLVVGGHVIILTHSKGNHLKSKHRFIERFFGDIVDGFVSTKDKWVVKSGTGKDIFIDDRNENLTSHSALFKIRFNTIWEQTISDDEAGVSFVANNWLSVLEYVKRHYKR